MNTFWEMRVEVDMRYGSDEIKGPYMLRAVLAEEDTYVYELQRCGGLDDGGRWGWKGHLDRVLTPKEVLKLFFEPKLFDFYKGNVYVVGTDPYTK